jgi:exodeoxyribonuclease VII large subunit
VTRGIKPSDLDAVGPADVAARVADLLAKFPAVVVRGTLSHVNRSNAGHLYFVLSGGGSSFRCLMYRGTALRHRLMFDPADGREVVAGGRLSLYRPRGDVQFVVSRMWPAADG